VEETGGKVFGVEGAGHWLMESHPEVVNEKLLEWFRS
jgi:pimeloyl-ACP methyl ester carboxylesterase